MTPSADPTQLKSCCASLYESDFARLLLGDSFHPGGQRLTARLGEHLHLRPGLRVLDVASGKGESAIVLAHKFGCEVVGVDFGAENVRQSIMRADATTVAHLVSFVTGDAEHLDFPSASFDAIVCECAFCTFFDKSAAASEFARVLRPGGLIGLSDLTRSGPLPQALEGLLSWISCIADARPVAEYAAYLEGAGFRIGAIEPHDSALADMARDIQNKLLGIELMIKLGKLTLPVPDLDQSKQFARAASQAIQQGVLGYSLITATLC